MTKRDTRKARREQGAEDKRSGKGRRDKKSNGARDEE